MSAGNCKIPLYHNNEEFTWIRYDPYVLRSVGEGILSALVVTPNNELVYPFTGLSTIYAQMDKQEIGEIPRNCVIKAIFFKKDTEDLFLRDFLKSIGIDEETIMMPDGELEIEIITFLQAPQYQAN